MQQSQVAGFGLFEADQQFAVAVEPGVSSFHHPSAGFGVWVSIFQQPLFGARFHAKIVAVLSGDLANWIADIARIQTQILLAVQRSLRTLDHDLGQSSIQKLRVVDVGAADGDR